MISAHRRARSPRYWLSPPYLLLPDQPDVWASACSYGVPLRPGTDGHWKVWPKAKTNVVLELVMGAVILISAIGYLVMFA